MTVDYQKIEVEITDREDARRIEDSGLDGSDIFIYNGDIIPDLHDAVRECIGSHGNRRAFLLLTTSGGDADTAFRVARNFQDSYDDFVVGIWGYCKSAGTLLAIGAHELVIAPCGELGPLDVQVHSPDEFMRPSSGLSISQAIEFITEQAFRRWEDSFLRLRMSSQGIITTKTAAEIANRLAVGLFAPVMERIDPLWVGELQRSINIAKEYGRRLGMPEVPLQQLIRGYPSHSFVIDFKEASRLFPNVRRPEEGERLLFDRVWKTYRKKWNDFLVEPIDLNLLLDISVSTTQATRGEGDDDNENANCSEKAHREVDARDTRGDDPSGAARCSSPDASQDTEDGSS